MSSIISTVEAPARRSIEQTCDELAALLLAVISVISLLTFKDYGLGWDDYTHAEYADLLLQLYRSGFHDAHALSFANLYMYGGGFDMAAALLHKIMPLDLFETARRTAREAGRDPASIEFTVGIPDDIAQLADFAAAGVSRVLVPVTGVAGLARKISGPEDLLGWRETIERYATL